VTSAKVMADRFTGRSRGFGFMEMSTQEEAEQTINALYGRILEEEY
jgi:RNA recognition motif-containing protein